MYIFSLTQLVCFPSSLSTLEVMARPAVCNSWGFNCETFWIVNQTSWITNPLLFCDFPCSVKAKLQDFKSRLDLNNIPIFLKNHQNRKCLACEANYKWIKVKGKTFARGGNQKKWNMNAITRFAFLTQPYCFQKNLTAQWPPHQLCASFVNHCFGLYISHHILFPHHHHRD